MYCGSCLQDNALAKALIQLGHDALLVPTYTPILTDEESVSQQQLFYGGLNVYLQQTLPVLKWIPRWADAFLSAPKLVNWVASRAMGTSAGNLGPLTVSMLRGREGRQRKEVDRLCDWLKTQEPDVVVFSNLLIAGCIPELKRQLGCPVVVILQGDDIFFESLVEPHRQQALKELQRLAQLVDLFVVHSQDYGLRMQDKLQFPAKRLTVQPLSIDTQDFLEWPTRNGSADAPKDRAPTVGYLARLAPEKGLHLLVEAFIELAGQLPDVRLAIAGWLGKQHTSYWQEQQDKLAAAGLNDRCQYHGSVDRDGKLEFLRSIDVLCVPTPYLEPKGIFLLEGLAAGVPYVQPDHGAFPELFQRLGGGHLVTPNSVEALTGQLRTMLTNLPETQQLGWQGRQRVLEEASMQRAAQRFAKMLDTLCSADDEPPPAEHS